MLREAEVRVAGWVVLLVAGEAVEPPRVAVLVAGVAPRVAVAEVVLVAREAVLPVVSCF